ncbi:hypothetical protein [Halomonas sp. BM-2019]|uniref:hypothetical protein n=1 Tax=Halomonas sp. BM-2019 TaxID=2811227 RepID=UPI001B3C37BD|nr:MAG: hypothetical protein J5F18_16660 [Halomonas sp. BM-2019]
MSDKKTEVTVSPHPYRSQRGHSAKEARAFAATSSRANEAGGRDEIHGARVRFFYAF